MRTVTIGIFDDSPGSFAEPGAIEADTVPQGYDRRKIGCEVLIVFWCYIKSLSKILLGANFKNSKLVLHYEGYYYLGLK